MRQKRAYHAAVARALVATGRVEEAEKHLDAVAILTDTITWTEEDAADPEDRGGSVA